MTWGQVSAFSEPLPSLVDTTTSLPTPVSVLTDAGPAALVGVTLLVTLGLLGASNRASTLPSWLLPGRTTDSEEFFVGDRTVGPVAGGATLAATQISAGTLVGTVGVHYLTGAGFLVIWVGIWLGWIASALLIGPKMRAFGGVTVPDFLAARFDAGADGAAIRALSALLIVVAYLVYTAAQYLAAARVTEALFGVDGRLVMVALTLVVLGYVGAGGMRASVRTDVLQVTLLVVGTCVAAVGALSAVGWFEGLYAGLRAVDPTLAVVGVDPLRVVGVGMEPVRLLGFALAFGFALMAAPNELSRMYAMRDPGTVRRAIGVSIGLQAVIAVSIAVLGLVARVRFPGLTSPDTAVVRLVASLFGPAVGGLLVVAVLAAVLSTVDSVLLVSASTFAHDFFGEALPALTALSPPSEASVLRAARVATVLAGVVPLGLALFPGPFGELVQLIVAFYASLIGASLLVPLLAGFHWDGATARGAIAGTTTGFLVATGWQFLVRRGTLLPEFAVLDPVLPGITVNAVVLIAVSVLDDR
ncbi:sodium:solute symporter [Halobaculum sp. MBLA0147]|uniref:sodium:solute symporter family protein n=1 Tax=Halobaculum sp. MBLA0147 TaxID=3079934 RepID=UPI0035255D64